MAYVYIYEIPELNAVKIGKTSSSAKNRMWDYAEAHDFMPKASSLRTIHVGDMAYDDVESILHRKIGLSKLYWGNATEIFKKGNNSYESIYENMVNIIDNSVDDNGQVRRVANVDWGNLVGKGLMALFSGGRRSKGFQNAIMKEVFGVKPRRRRKSWF